MLRLGTRGLGRGGKPVLAEVPRQGAALERVIPAADARRHARYLRATDGLRIARLSDGLLSPALPATWETALALELLAALDPPLPPGAILHTAAERVILRPLQARETVRCRLELAAVETVQKGVRATLVSRNWSPGGQLLSEGKASFLARTRARAPSVPARAREEIAENPGAEPWIEVARWRLSAAAGRRYAAVSGDWNPIHLTTLSARLFGLPAAILHGYCIEAMVVHALIEHRLGGDPRALKRIGIQFRAPLLLPATAVLRVREDDAGRRFQVWGNGGEMLCAEGSWTG
jgi:acyl dehydratase